MRTSKTLREAATASLEASRARLKPGTVLQYEHIREKRLLPWFGSRRISAIAGEGVEKWIADLVAEGLAPNPVHNHYVLLNKRFRYALRHRLIPFNPADGVELPKNVRSEGFAPVFLTAKQVEALAAEMPAPLDTLVRFAAYTGLRAAEIAGLRVRDLNLAAGHVEVRPTMKWVNKECKAGTPKSVRSTRNVPLVHSGLKTELRMLLLAHPNSGDPTRCSGWDVMCTRTSWTTRSR